MKNRRDFIKLTAIGGVAAAAGSSMAFCSSPEQQKNSSKKAVPKTTVKPIVISTWRHGLAANKASWEILQNSGSALDAVEQGVRITESDPNNLSVGLGGLPDRDGKVTLDACIMDHRSRCGSVAFLQHIENPISVARKVMEETPHVMLVGNGALKFALEQGFKKTNLLTKKAKEAWEKWVVHSKYLPKINSENHDTIGQLALDSNGNLSGACTTSGAAYKLHGRVGDSPLIGSGLFVDNEVGAACGTGLGEAIIRVAGSAIVVELMRNGMSPADACKEAVLRIKKAHPDDKNLQVCFIALNKYGEHGGYSLHNGFNYALKTEQQEDLIDTNFEYEWESIEDKKEEEEVTQD